MALGMFMLVFIYNVNKIARGKITGTVSIVTCTSGMKKM